MTLTPKEVKEQHNSHKSDVPFAMSDKFVDVNHECHKTDTGAGQPGDEETLGHIDTRCGRTQYVVGRLKAHVHILILKYTQRK